MSMTSADFAKKVHSWAKDFRKNKLLWRRFRDCVGDVERIRMVRTYLAKNRIRIEGRRSSCAKSSAAAERALKIGDQVYFKGFYVNALGSYNKAICSAPWPQAKRRRGQEKVEPILALAFEKRADLLFKESRYGDCVRDVDNALVLGAPVARRRALLLLKIKALIAARCYRAAVACLEYDVVELGVCPEGYHRSADGVLDPAVAEFAGLHATAGAGSRMAATPRTGHRGSVRHTHPDGYEMLQKLKKLELAGGPHPVFQAGSSLLKLKFSPEAGRHFVAAADLSGGEILVIEPAFVAADDGPHCCACLVWTDTPFPCRTCELMCFCSSLCANGPKGRQHAVECEYFDAVANFGMHVPTPDGIAILVARTLLTKTAEEWREFAKRSPGNLPGEADEFEGPPKAAYLPDDYDNVFCLVKKSKRWDPMELLTAAFYACGVVAILEKSRVFDKVCDDAYRDFVGGVALRHFQNYKLNSTFTFDYLVDALRPGSGGPDFASSGKAVYPTYALFNFSCDANVFATFYADRVVVTASRPVRAGELLAARSQTSQYQNVGRADRRAYLAREHFYKCACQACEEDWPVHQVLESRKLVGDFVVCCPECGNEFGAMRDAWVMFAAIARCPGCRTEVEDVMKRIERVCRIPNSRSATRQVLFDATKEAWKCFKPPSAALIQYDMEVMRKCRSEGNRFYVNAGLPDGRTNPEQCSTT